MEVFYVGKKYWGDRLTKSAHFLALKTIFNAEQLADLYIKEIVRLYGIPLSIVSDHDIKFTSKFWHEFQLAMGTELCLSTAFHPPNRWSIEKNYTNSGGHVKSMCLRICWKLGS